MNSPPSPAEESVEPEPQAPEPATTSTRHPGLRLAWKIATISLGGALVLLGIVGLFLPVLQGWLMIFGGLAVLSPHSRRARTILRMLKDKLGRK